MKINTLAVLSALAIVGSVANAAVTPNSLFTDNAILQREVSVPVWGTASNGEKVNVEIAGQHLSTVAQNGEWLVRLKPVKAGGPYTLRITGENKIQFKNILFGDVWICSGQSNMEKPLGHSFGQDIPNYQQEIANATHPNIHEYYVPKQTSYTPIADSNSKWTVCGPDTVADYSAVGYFFVRDLQPNIKVPVGMIFTAWGGTLAEAWTSPEYLSKLPDFQKSVERIKQFDTIEGRKKQLDEWYQKNDPGSANGANWQASDFDDSSWKTMPVPSVMQNTGLSGFNGIVWFRTKVNLSADEASKAAVLHLGPIDDNDTTWINGQLVGATEGFATQRNYTISAGVLKAGDNVITVRLLDTGGIGGINGTADQLKLELPNSGIEPISFAGNWKYKETTSITTVSSPAPSALVGPNDPTALYNAMITPLIKFPIKGVIWYQGEANNDRAKQYQTLFPTLIDCWRNVWNEPNLPFLYVQIAPYRDMTPEIREAQFLTLFDTHDTAMAVITDAGVADDIHPGNKQIVGARLALAALAKAYGRKIEYSGPLYKSYKIRGNHIEISFTHTGKGLVAKGGELKGFTIAGADKKFLPAQAQIVGDKVSVWNDSVDSPVAVRYGWANVPDVNLYNVEGLLASPFRTDVDK